MISLPLDVDSECIELCTAMNRLPGIATAESCCGHGTVPYRIWFRVTDFSARGLLTLARLTCDRYYDGDWEVKLTHGDTPGNIVSFYLEGAVGPERYAFAQKLAKHIIDHVEGTLTGFNILLADEQRLRRSSGDERGVQETNP